MNKIIKNLLEKIIGDIDSGNSNITEEDSIKIIEALQGFTNHKRYSKYSAARYLHISESRLDQFIKEERLSPGKHEQGFKEISWSQCTLDLFKKNYIKYKRKEIT